MIDEIPVAERSKRLLGAGLSDSAARAFLQGWESFRVDSTDSSSASLSRDAALLGQVCRQGRDLLARLPLKSGRDANEQAAGHALVHLLADAAWRFFRIYRKPIYDALTRQRALALRVDELAWAGADLLPGVLPSRAELAAESASRLADKDGLEIHQGLFFGQLLSERDIGLHLCTAMLRPTAEALERREEFQRSGALDLGAVRVQAKGEAGYLFFTIRAISTPRTTIRFPRQRSHAT